MKRHLLASMILVGLAAAQPALSADLPRRAAPAPYVPMMAAYNWTGFYIGGNLGYGWGDVSHDVTGIGRTQVFSPAGALLFDSGPVGGSGFSNKANIDGFVGGGQLGWNWQTSNWVWGIETDIQATGQKGDHSGTVLVPGLAIREPLPLPAQALFLAGQPQLNWFGTLRGRVGILPTDRWLLYVTGGLAYGDLESSIGPVSISKTKAGWVVGAGVEAALWDRWTWKVEYLYMDLGGFDTSGIAAGVTLPGPGAGQTTVRSFAGNGSTEFTNNILRVGLNYRF